MAAEAPAGGQSQVAGSPFQNVQRLVLTGFMGSGKSSVGRLVAQKLAWEFFDLDSCVEARLGLTVPQIFAQQGEAAFRDAEVHDLADLLARSRRVIALGGGAPGTAALRDLLARSPGTVVVHLQAPVSVLYERCRKQALEPSFAGRPLLGDKESAERRYNERLQLYASIAHCVAKADLPSVEAVAAEILTMLDLPAISL